MHRNYKTDKEKEILRYIKEYKELIDCRKREEHGQWVDVEEPYQQGWVRWYILRDNITNRRDAHSIARCLDLINITQRCRRKNFTSKNWKTGKWEPYDDELHTIDPATYKTLSEKEQSFFSPRLTKLRKFDEHYTLRYVWNFKYFFVFKVVPNMIYQRWVPDEEWASRVAEMRHKIETHNLWPKHAKAKGYSLYGWDYDVRNPLYRFKLGEPEKNKNWLDETA